MAVGCSSAIPSKPGALHKLSPQNLSFPIPRRPPQVVMDGYEALIRKCWADDPKARPSFLEVIEELRWVSGASGYQTLAYVPAWPLLRSLAAARWPHLPCSYQPWLSPRWPPAGAHLPWAEERERAHSITATPHPPL